MTVLHCCARGRGSAKGTHCYYASRYTLFSFNARNFRPTRRWRIDARARIKWLNTLRAINISAKGPRRFNR